MPLRFASGVGAGAGAGTVVAGAVVPAVVPGAVVSAGVVPVVSGVGIFGGDAYTVLAVFQHSRCGKPLRFVL